MIDQKTLALEDDSNPVSRAFGTRKEEVVSLGNESRARLERIRATRKCAAFACVCALLAMGGALVSMSLAVVAEEADLATGESAGQWRAEDVFLQPSGYWGWHVRKPLVLDPYGFEIPFNHYWTGEYTVYVHNTWTGDLTGMEIVATVSIRVDSGDPDFITRTLGDAAFVRLEFQTTTGSWDELDYWWSYSCFSLEELVGTSKTFTVPLDGALWQCINGGWTGELYPEEFAEALASVHEVGLSFGRSASWASGAAVDGGEATFIVESYLIQPTENPT